MWKYIWLCLVAIWALVYFLLNAAGTLQTAKDLFQNRGEIMKAIGAVATSQWLPLGLFIATALVILQVEFGFSWFRSRRVLRGSIPNVAFAEDQDHVAGVFPLLSITNSGPPTTVDIQTATIKSGGKSFTLTSIIYAEGHYFGATGIVINKSDMIVEKLATPIPTGGRTQGFLFYELRGVPLADLKRNRFEIAIRFKDAEDNKYEAYTSSDQFRNDGVYIPGIDNPFLRLKKPHSTPPPPAPGTGASPP